jgi:hypothetical protein
MPLSWWERVLNGFSFLKRCLYLVKDTCIKNAMWKNRKVVTRSEIFLCLSVFLFCIKLPEKNKILPVEPQSFGPPNICFVILFLSEWVFLCVSSVHSFHGEKTCTLRKIDQCCWIEKTQAAAKWIPSNLEHWVSCTMFPFENGVIGILTIYQWFREGKHSL